MERFTKKEQIQIWEDVVSQQHEDKKMVRSSKRLFGENYDTSILEKRIAARQLIINKFKKQS